MAGLISQSRGLAFRCSPLLVRCFSATSTALRGEAIGKPEAVIFDKDGTLVCFHSMWSPWVDGLSQRVCDYTGKDVTETLASTMGYCLDTKRIVGDNALLAHATMPIVLEKVTDALGTAGLEKQEAAEAIDNCWEENSTSSRNTVVPLFDVKALFEALKAVDVKIAICSADARSGCEGAMAELGVDHLVDTMVCGDDKNTLPKPAARNAQIICDTLGVDPLNTIMVGDTTADIGMGYNAGLGATVGVLSGIGSSHDLYKSDYLYSTANQVFSLVSRRAEWRRRTSAEEWTITEGHTLAAVANRARCIK